MCETVRYLFPMNMCRRVFRRIVWIDNTNWCFIHVNNFILQSRPIRQNRIKTGESAEWCSPMSARFERARFDTQKNPFSLIHNSKLHIQNAFSRAILHFYLILHFNSNHCLFPVNYKWLKPENDFPDDRRRHDIYWIFPDEKSNIVIMLIAGKTNENLNIKRVSAEDKGKYSINCRIFQYLIRAFQALICQWVNKHFQFYQSKNAKKKSVKLSYTYAPNCPHRISMYGWVCECDRATVYWVTMTDLEFGRH